ncbi:MAG TPA: Nif3-like dinuclear metal center hexameric protein [Candidatus Deferrimicrobiaceae bacterium]
MTAAGTNRIRSAVTVRQVREALDERYPFAHRADWDNVGILAGDPDQRVRTILVALDATPAAVDRCRASKADLLVTHHPVIHSPLKAVRPDRADSSAVFRLLTMGVAVLSAHTNADVAPQGVSHVLARRIGLRGIRPLIPGEPSDACKVVVFVPPDRADAVLAALSEAGGGRIGAYTRCSFRTLGTGTFLPEAGASPWTGTPGALERVEEIRLESVVAGPLVPAVLRAVRAVHPYEEPAIDVIPLRGGALGGGVGAIGERERKAPLDRVLGEIFRFVRPSWILVAGPARKSVGRIAVVGGSGSEFAEAARAAGADLFVTADVKYHRALEAAAGEMPVADIGHGSGEKWILPEFRRTIVSRFGDRVSVQVFMENEPLRPWRPGNHRGGTRN